MRKLLGQWKSSIAPELEIHTEDTLKEFSVLLMILGGIAGFRATYVGVTGQAAWISLGIGVLLIGAGVGVIRLLDRIGFEIAWYSLALAAIVAIALESWAFPGSAARYYYPIVILISSLLSSRNGTILIAILAAIAHLIVARSFTVDWADTGWIQGPLFLIAATAIGAFLASRHLRSALETAESFSARASDMLEEIRLQRAELTKTVKALGEANARLEQLNIELDKARASAEEADRFKSEFLAHMSHELRTPLNAILNFSAFVADGLMGDVNQAQVETLQKVIDSGNHLLTLINDVLDISKIEAGMMTLFIEEVDINAALNATTSIAKGLVKDKPIELITDIEGNLPHISGDKRRIRQIFLNLVSNAVKFTPQGSITLTGNHQNGELIISVADTGIGIAPEDQKNIFEPFKQAQHDLRNVIGTGLGLSITKHFVEAHGGRIELTSQPGKGSKFRVSLPVDYLKDQQSTAPAAQPAAAQG